MDATRSALLFAIAVLLLAIIAVRRTDPPLAEGDRFPLPVSGSD